MGTTSNFSVGLAAKFCGAAGEAGFTPDELNVLAENPGRLGQFLSVVRGRSEVTVRKHIINLDAAPLIPSGLELRESDQPSNRARGQFEWSSTKVRLHLDEIQKDGNVIEGNKLRKQLGNEPVLPATLLDYLLANPHLIPEEWKGKAVYFWGTIYRAQFGNLCVRCLIWRDGQWRAYYGYLFHGWDDLSPAALAG